MVTSKARIRVTIRSGTYYIGVGARIRVRIEVKRKNAFRLQTQNNALPLRTCIGL